MNLRELTRPQNLPADDARLPAVAVRVALAVTGVLLSLVVYGTSGWLVLGILLSFLAASAPAYLVGWGLILFLGAGELGRQAALSWQLLVLIAGVHLLHLLATFTLALPWRSWIQPAVFARPLLRFVSVQIPVQLFAVAALLLLAPNGHGHRPLTITEFTAIGAAALVTLALMLLRTRPDQRG